MRHHHAGAATAAAGIWHCVALDTPDRTRGMREDGAQFCHGLYAAKKHGNSNSDCGAVI